MLDQPGHNQRCTRQAAKGLGVLPEKGTEKESRSQLSQPGLSLNDSGLLKALCSQLTSPPFPPRSVHPGGSLRFAAPK